MQKYNLTHRTTGETKIVNSETIEEMAYDLMYEVEEYDYELKNIGECIEALKYRYEIIKHAKLKGFYSYNGFGEPEYLGSSIKELVNNTTVTHSYIIAQTDVTNEFQDEINEELEYHGLKIEDEITMENAEKLAYLLYDYHIWVNPTYEEFVHHNRHVGLEDDQYISELFD